MLAKKKIIEIISFAGLMVAMSIGSTVAHAQLQLADINPPGWPRFVTAVKVDVKKSTWKVTAAKGQSSDFTFKLDGSTTYNVKGSYALDASFTNTGGVNTLDAGGTLVIKGSISDSLGNTILRSNGQDSLFSADLDDFGFAGSVMAFTTSNLQGSVCDLYGCTGGETIWMSFADTILADLTQNFKTTGNVTTTVPVPAAVWLFGSGIIGLVGMARRRQVVA